MGEWGGLEKGLSMCIEGLCTVNDDYRFRLLRAENIQENKETEMQ